MSSTIESVVRTCPSCGHAMELGELACPSCFAFVHAAELSEISREATKLERAGRLADARLLWGRSLPLLPPDAKQTEWVQGRLAALEHAMDEAREHSEQKAHTPAWAKRLGPLAPIAILLVKAKGLLLAIFKLKFLFSFFAFLGVYVAMFGWKFGVGFAASILLHELGHYVDIKRRGLPAEMPVFLPGLGAYVRWTALGVTRRQVAQISLAGPLAGWITAAGCALIYMQTRQPVWAALAYTGAWLNLLNLIPVWQLDGGQAVRSLGMVERLGLMAVTLAMWAHTREMVFFLMALGVGWSLFAKDKPVEEDWGTWLYFAALIAALGLTLHAMPGAAMVR